MSNFGSGALLDPVEEPVVDMGDVISEQRKATLNTEPSQVHHLRPLGGSLGGGGDDHPMGRSKGR